MFTCSLTPSPANTPDVISPPATRCPHPTCIPVHPELQDTLADHAAVHTGTKRWCCGTCGKEHRLRSGLYLCEKTHQGSDHWSHKCQQCGKKFISKQKLIMHIR